MTGVARVLVELLERGVVTDDLFLPVNSAHYARRLVHRDPHARFIIVAMTWAQGQGSPLHDHAGLWGAEVVARGQMVETMFALQSRDDDGRYRFTRGLHRVNEPGTVGVLVPPLEYHAFGNHGGTVAHTLHVYGGELGAAQSFFRDEDGWWNACRVELRYDG